MSFMSDYQAALRKLQEENGEIAPSTSRATTTRSTVKRTKNATSSQSSSASDNSFMATYRREKARLEEEKKKKKQEQEKKEKEEKKKAETERQKELSENRNSKRQALWQEQQAQLLAEDDEDIRNRLLYSASDISPTRAAFMMAGENPSQDERKWFQKGAFEDGYDFGDVTKTILGSVSDISENISTGIIGMGEKVVDTMAMLAPGAYQGAAIRHGGQQGFDFDEYNEQKKAVDEFVAKDLYDEEKIAKTILASPFNRLTQLAGIDSEADSVFGEKSDSLVQSAGQLAATIGLSGVGVPWWVTTGATTFGAEAETALKEGATHEEATLSAAITAAAEILSEKISGGIKFGGKTFDAGLTNALSRGISNKFVRTAVDLGVGGLGEGLEEIVSNFGSSFGKWLTYQDEETLKELLFSEEAMDEHIEAFIGGMVLGGGSKAINAVQSSQKGVDAVTGLTANEQKVVDELYKERVAEEEANDKGRRRKKSEIYDELLEDMEKGYITTDDIERVLGGEDYQSYRDTVDSEDAQIKQLQEQLKELDEAANTVGNAKRYDAIQSQIDELMENAKHRDGLRAQLSKNVFDMVKNDRLRESYFEVVRSKQKFDVDLDKYEGRAKEVMRKVMESELADNSNQSHEFWDLMANLSTRMDSDITLANDEQILEMVKEQYKAEGREFDESKFKGQRIDGFIGKDGIVINSQTKRALNFVVGHEITHALEKTKHYGKFQKLFLEFAQDEYESRYNERAGQYGNKFADDSTFKANVDKEITGDLTGDYLFTDKNFVTHLTKDADVFNTVFDEIKYMAKIATTGSQTQRQLLRVQREFERAWRERNKEATDTKYSISDSDGRQLTAEQQEYFRDSKVRDYQGNLLKVYHTTNNEFTVFDKARRGEATQDANTYLGFFFTDDAEYMQNFPEFQNGKTDAYYLNIKNPIDMTNISKEAFLDIVEVMGGNVQEAATVYDEEMDAARQRARNRGDNNATLLLSNLLDTMTGEYYYEDFYEELRPHYDELVAKGYDGVVNYMDELTGTREYIILDSNQAKLASNANPTTDPDIRYSLSSMANTFFGDENMSANDFAKADYKQTQGYKDYVESCLNNYRQTRKDFDETVARKEIKDAIDGIVQVAIAAKRAGYDIYDDASKRSVKDSKKRLLFSSLEPNSDYFTSNDISTICDKRKNFADIYDEIVRTEEAKGVPVDKRFFNNVDNYFYLHKLMADKGLTQPCRQCYVESMRKNLAPMASAFLRLVKETNPDNTANDQLYQQRGKNKGNLKVNNAATREWVIAALAEYDMSANELTVETLTTADGLAELKIRAPMVYEAFNSFYGQSKPKMPKSATPFRFGELTALLTDERGNIKRSLVDKINSTGGFRLQSYSDFQIQNFTDTLQVLFEAGTLGLRGHSYTKVPAFLDATEGTNLKRNISIFMYKDGNEWKLDRNDSFPYTLEEIYGIVQADTTGNTGIIAVSQNEDMSAWIMANDFVGYGIPFHKSGNKMGTVRDTDVVTEDGRIVKGYSGTKDHTRQQTEVWAKTSDDHKALTKVKTGINIYRFWDFDNKSNLSKNELIEKNVKAYIDACEQAGYLPKFREYVMNNGKVLNGILTYAKELGFAAEDATIADISFEYKGYTIPYGYYKFLGDFGMFKPDGTASSHEVLSLKNYDFDKAVEFFSDAATLRRNEILQQFANGAERQHYRDSDFTAEELEDVVRQKRREIAEGVAGGNSFSLSDINEQPTKGRGWNVYGKDILLDKGEAPVSEIDSTMEDLTDEQIAGVEHLYELGDQRDQVLEQALALDAKEGKSDAEVAEMESLYAQADELRNEIETRVDELFPDELAPMAEEIVTEQQSENLASITDADAPMEADVAPVAETVQPVREAAPPVEAPVAPAPQTKVPKAQPKPKPVAKAQPVQQQTKTAEILTEEPKVERKKSKLGQMLVSNLVDKGAVFETMSIKNKNPELQAKYKAIGRAESSAQYFMKNGLGKAKSLTSIREMVENSGKTKEFYEYMYHMHNIDRMSLESRFKGAQNKSVFGDAVTADVSREAVAKLEKANPQFKKYAQSVYNYMGTLRNMMVENGIISKETANMWQKMYPHYVPIRRAGDVGLNVNVPLDSNKTGVNAPIKRATGGNSDILPLFETMALRTEQTFKAVANNRFGVELKNMLKSTVAQEAVGIDEAIESVGAQDGLLQEGKNGQNPTFTVFENGKRVTFEITEEMYDAMKPTNKYLAKEIKPLMMANDWRRKLLTEYNLGFLATNAIKDAQDVIINSQHPIRTYANVPEAIRELWSKGKWYQERMSHGGAQDTYFDKNTQTFTKEKSMLRKVVGAPLGAISAANNFIEQIPRMAEYIASRKMGHSIDVSMMHAARVTTDFSAGGDVTKFFNRHGATFLNASIQGAAQHVRNIREAKANGIKGVLALGAKITAAGLPFILLNNLLWDDDEEYEELSDYIKQNYYIVGKYGDGQFVRIPKGRALAVVQNAFEQMEKLVKGEEVTADDIKTFGDLMISNLAPNNPLDNNLLAPIGQAFRNETWYGEDLVPSRLQDVPAAEQYDESTDAISKWLGETAGNLGFDLSPMKINYLLDQYSGVVGDTVLPMLTLEAESGSDSVLGSIFAPIKDKFTADSTMDNQNVTDFYDLKDELTVNANSMYASDDDKLKSLYMNAVSSDLADLYAEKREIQNSDRFDSVKYMRIREIQDQIVELMKEGMGNYEGISYDEAYRGGGRYATIGDKVFCLNEKTGEWYKLSEEQQTKYEVTSAAGDANYATDGTNHYNWYVNEKGEAYWRSITDEQLEKQDEVTRGLGITPDEYWGAKTEYDYAYKYPENYAVSQAVGGYETYRYHTGNLYDIKADKDENGDSIPYSRKNKVLDYINDLDMDYGMKLILFKNEYNGDDTYNNEIIDYLNSREDLSYEEVVTILERLDFDVDENGYITW